MEKERAYKLKYPIPTEDKKAVIENLNIDRLKVKHLKYLPKGAESGKITPYQMIPLIANLCRITKKEADELDMEDLVEIGEVINNQMGKLQSPETGEM